MYLKGVDRVNKEMNNIKLLNEVRTHHIALRSSILCSQERQELVGYVNECCIDVNSANDSYDDDHVHKTARKCKNS